MTYAEFSDKMDLLWPKWTKADMDIIGATFGVSGRTLYRWRSGQTAIPPLAVEKMAGLKPKKPKAA